MIATILFGLILLIVIIILILLIKNRQLLIYFCYSLLFFRDPIPMQKNTIRLSKKTKNALEELKTRSKISFDDVISDLLKNKDKNKKEAIKIFNSNECLIETVKPHTNMGRISVPPSWIGEEVVVVLKKDLETE